MSRRLSPEMQWKCYKAADNCVKTINNLIMEAWGMKIEKFEVYINYHVQKQEKYNIRAQNREEAEEIARQIFMESRDSCCVFDSIAKRRPMPGFDDEKHPA